MVCPPTSLAAPPATPLAQGRPSVLRRPPRARGWRFFAASAVLHGAVFAALWGTGVAGLAPARTPGEITCDVPLTDDRPPPPDVVEPSERPVLPPLDPVPPEVVLAPDDVVPAEEVVAELPPLPPLGPVTSPTAVVDVPVGRPLARPRAAPAVAAAPAVPVVASSRPVTAPPSAAGPVRGGVLVRPFPHPDNRPPGFPADALARGERGSVLLRLTISEQGTVTDVVVERSSGSDALDRAAREGVAAWRFSPALRDGVPVVAILRQSIRFS